MKKFIVLMVCLALFSNLMSSSAKAEDITGTEAEAEDILRWLPDSSPMLEDYDFDNFNPTGKVTYGEICQWFYNVIVEPDAYPSKKKAVAWVKKAYYKVALDYPQYATTLLTWFTDGKYAKFNSKKQVSWDWIVNTAYVMCYYRERIPFAKKYAFDCNTENLNGYLWGFGDYKTDYHSKWCRSYAKKSATKPIRIEALDLMEDLANAWDG